MLTYYRKNDLLNLLIYRIINHHLSINLMTFISRPAQIQVEFLATYCRILCGSHLLLFTCGYLRKPTCEVIQFKSIHKHRVCTEVYIVYIQHTVIYLHYCKHIKSVQKFFHFLTFSSLSDYRRK